MALVGFAGGAEFDLIAYITARYFGLRHFGAIYGTLYSLFVLGSGMAPPLFSRGYDTTGSYVSVLQAAAGCFVVGGLLILTLRAYPKTLPSPDVDAHGAS